MIRFLASYNTYQPITYSEDDIERVWVTVCIVQGCCGWQKQNKMWKILAEFEGMKSTAAHTANNPKPAKMTYRREQCSVRCLNISLIIIH